MAAGSAVSSGARVLLLEKNLVPGKKLSITGKGRCNVTNITDRDGFIVNLPGNGQFLFSCLSAFDNNDTINFFNNLGVPLKTERGGRVFPESDDAGQIVQALMKWAHGGDSDIRFDAKVIEIEKTVEGYKLQLADGSTIEAAAVIIATGGASYPGTGSSGDGYRFAKNLGHTIITPSPALVPLVSNTEWIKDAQGLSLRNVQVELHQGGKVIGSEFGEMLVTHFGVSGPVILTLSRKVTEARRRGTIRRCICQ
jgi:predicted Rossmann fold flavoprotein